MSNHHELDQLFSQAWSTASSGLSLGAAIVGAMMFVGAKSILMDTQSTD